MQEMIAFSEARAIVLEYVQALETTVRVDLDEALHATLAGDVVSRDAIPPFDNSAMDGFALRSNDVRTSGSTLVIAGEIAAGTTDSAIVSEGTCVRIMTGAPMPQGADAVLPIEVASVRDDERTVTFEKAADRGENVRRSGEDIRPGTRVLEAGCVVGPPEIAVLASLGYARVDVARPPSVAIVTTGDELIEPSEPLRPGKIRDTNGPALAAQVSLAGGRVIGRFRARDDRSVVRATLADAMRADVIIVSGGISVGEYDFVKDELAALGMELHFWRVRQRPGKPLAFGLLEGKPVFALPGNPVSSAVCFEVYARPALAAMLGRREVVRPMEPAVLGADVSKRHGLHYFARGRSRWSGGRLVVDPVQHQGSHVASSLVEADGLIHLPEELHAAPAGTDVAFERLRH